MHHITVIVFSQNPLRLIIATDVMVSAMHDEAYHAACELVCEGVQKRSGLKNLRAEVVAGALSSDDVEAYARQLGAVVPPKLDVARRAIQAFLVLQILSGLLIAYFLASIVEAGLGERWVLVFCDGAACTISASWYRKVRRARHKLKALMALPKE